MGEKCLYTYISVVSNKVLDLIVSLAGSTYGAYPYKGFIEGIYDML